MKKLLSIFSFIIILSLSSQAQYYYNSYNPAGQNPGGLNTDDEQPAEPGYVNIIAPGTTTLTWSSVQAIPFSFDFNGSPVTQYKVSNSGVLTFTTSASTVPSFSNMALPNAAIPDNSICLWGLQQFAGNDAVRTKTFGTAPNRQHWIYFASFSAPGASGTQWTYWGIVLEETTNKVYLVDMRTYQTPISLSIGVQIDASTAVQLPASPNVPSYVTNGGNASSAADNVFYEFIPGTRPVNEAELASLSVEDIVSNAGATSISGTIKNGGSANLTSVEVHWTVDGGATVNKDTISMNLPTNSIVSFSHNLDWTPATPGVYYDLEVWTSKPNGAVDPINYNDTLSRDIFVNTGTTVQRNVLLEEFTTSVCQFCPDGTYTMEQILNSNPNVIGVGIHAGFGTDSMTIPEHSTIAAAFTTSAPAALVDRLKFAGEENVAFSARSLWASRANTRSGEGSPLSMSMTGSYDPNSRLVTLDVDANFVDYAVPGDIRLTLYVVEDSVSKTGPPNTYFQGWDQINAYYGTSGHPYYQVGLPTTTPGVSIIQGFEHRHVVRDVYPTTDAWGDNTVIPNAPTPNSTYSKNYSFNIPGSWDENQISLVAFVSYYNSDVEQRQVLNAEEIKISNIVTGIADHSEAINNLVVYPNPTSDRTFVKFNKVEQGNVQLKVYDLTGKQLKYENFGDLAKGNQLIDIDVSDLPNGFYFINLQVGEKQVSRKISVNR